MGDYMLLPIFSAPVKTGALRGPFEFRELKRNVDGGVQVSVCSVTAGGTLKMHVISIVFMHPSALAATLTGESWRCALNEDTPFFAQALQLAKNVSVGPMRVVAICHFVLSHVFDVFANQRLHIICVELVQRPVDVICAMRLRFAKTDTAFSFSRHLCLN